MKRIVQPLISGTALALATGWMALGCKPSEAPGAAAAKGGGGGMSFQVVAIEARRQPVAEVVSL
ncbi:MAG: hypothetical protein RL354_1502, partial [Planctomycetota bacterium]